jgi:hypothetical protein
MPAHQNDNYQRRVKYNDVVLPKQNHVAFAGDRVSATDTGTKSEIGIAAAGSSLTAQRAFVSYSKSQAMDTGGSLTPALDLGSVSASASNPLDVSVVSSGQIKPLVTGLYSITVYGAWQGDAPASDERFGLRLYETRFPGYGIYHEKGMTLQSTDPTPTLSWWYVQMSLTTYLTDTDYVTVRRVLGQVAAGGTLNVYTTVMRLI